MFSRPARMMEKMVGMMPIKSTRFILSVRNLLLFGQTSSRRKYLILTFGKQTSVFTLCSRRTHSMTKKAVAMLSMMCNITSTSSCSLIASMRKIPEQKENSSFAFCLGFSKSSLFRIIPESNQILKKSTQVCTIVSLDVASPCLFNVSLTGGDENHQNGDEGK